MSEHPMVGLARRLEATLNAERETVKRLAEGGIDDHPLRQKFVDAIMGALMYGSNNTNPAPECHWLEQFWQIGHESYRDKRALADAERRLLEYQAEIRRMDAYKADLHRLNDQITSRLAAAEEIIKVHRTSSWNGCDARDTVYALCDKLSAALNSAASGRAEVIIRNNDDGSLDEICTEGFHLEQMSDHCWWMEVVPGLHVNLTSRGTIKASVCDERLPQSAPAPASATHEWDAVGTRNPGDEPK